jgi:hypothetical protein
MIIEEAEELLSVFVDILWLFKKAGAQEVIEDLSQFGVILEIADVLFLDGVLN